MLKPLTKKRLEQEYENNPKLFWEIMTQDMIGKMPKTLKDPADEFLKTAGPKWESWLLYQSWKIQRRAATEPKHHDSFLGMIAFVGWLLHMATKSAIAPKKEASRPEAPKEKVDPTIGVQEFIIGMSKKRE